MYTNLENIPIFHFPTKPLMMESKWKSHIETAPNCPRCASSNTKFCYYNNYSFSQPRYFCKGCRRYWTKGGSLRNVPVGGGCRKSRRARSAARRAHHRDYGMHNPGDGVSRNESESGTQGVNIDLGAVFAKFLNQDSSKINDDGIKMDQESSKGASSSSSELAPMCYDSENRVDEFVFGSRIGSDFIDQTGVSLDVENVDEILDQNCSSLELQTILGDDMADVAIPDWLDDGWSLCNIIQELGLFSSDDEPKIASDPHSDQWSSDDLLGYEIFSRPSNQNPQINP